MLDQTACPEPIPGERRRAGWLLAAQRGDKAAYAKLLRECVPLVRRAARQHGVCDDRLDDVVQETLLALHRVRHTFDHERSFDAWLFSIARRRSIDLYRHDRPWRLCDADHDAAEARADPLADPCERHARTAENRRLHAAIAILPPAQREAIEHVALKERTIEAAACLTGRTTVATRVNFHRALKTLRSMLLTDGCDG